MGHHPGDRASRPVESLPLTSEDVALSVERERSRTGPTSGSGKVRLVVVRVKHAGSTVREYRQSGWIAPPPNQGLVPTSGCVARIRSSEPSP